MSDFNDVGNDRKSKFEQMAEKPFFTFSKPYLDFISKGKIFSIVYYVQNKYDCLQRLLIIQR
jgi:hypothetical protein